MKVEIRNIDFTWSVKLTHRGQIIAFGVGLTRRLAWENLRVELEAKS